MIRNALAVTVRGLAVLACLVAVRIARSETVVDVSGYRADCEVQVKGFNGHLIVNWPMGQGELGEVALDVSGMGPLIKQMVTRKGDDEAAAILGNVDPVWFLTVGERRLATDRPQEQHWGVFFDNPHQRPHETFASTLAVKKARVTGSGKRATVTVDGLTVGPFAGSVELTFYAGSPLMRIDAVVQTEKDRLAFFYDQGLVAEQVSWKEFVWTDTEGIRQSDKTFNRPSPQIAHAQRERSSPPPPQSLYVRHRTIVAAGERGSVACFPPPHQFQFPRDYSTNLAFVWAGKGYLGQGEKIGFGIRQHKDGGGNFVPWFNGQPGASHRMGAFYLLTSGTADGALQETLRYTHGDRFVELSGYKTFTSHYHMALAVRTMEEKAKGQPLRHTPEHVRVIRELGVNMLHLGEFHGDGHPKDPGPLRLPEMQAMFEECRRYSDDDFLLIPGEEGNDFLGLKLQGKHPGHWMSLFPRPVYWTMTRAAEQPFVEEIAPYGKVYHVGDRADMIRLLKEERGLVWSAHPRIKASNWTPDVFKSEDFFLAEFWLGGAWKAMPGDLSREKLGERVLDLLDDMANWGQKKYVPGEVDVFTIDHTHELYGHMNINYVQLERVPRYEEGWQQVLDVLRGGRFFVTTGEILMPNFTVGGKGSGDVLKLADAQQPELAADLQWTFPLAFAEVISGDGQKVYRERIDLSDTSSFGSRTLKHRPNLRGRRWVRLEIWDIAANGAFTQPVWIE